MAPTPQPSLVMQMQEASHTCRELMGVMLDENHSLTKFSAKETEARLQLKKRLALRLETLLADIKRQKGLFKGDRQAENLAVRLAEEINVFREIASKNEVMLRAAHQIRADMVSVIRDTLEASQPRVTTYNASGYVQNGSGGTVMLGTVV